MSGEPDRENNFVPFISWQDSLLQSYRSLYFSVEFTMLAAFMSLVLFRLEPPEGFLGSSPDKFFMIALFVIRGGFAWLTLLVAWRRCDDVDFWHLKLLRFEKSLPPEKRHFSQFKFWQANKPLPFDPDREPEDLMGKGMGHTRKIYHIWIPLALSSIWVVLLVLFLSPANAS